jgi:hypothetical protein
LFIFDSSNPTSLREPEVQVLPWVEKVAGLKDTKNKQKLKTIEIGF